MDAPAESPPQDATLSLTRLRAAFARMLGKPEDDPSSPPAADPDAVTPEGIAEAILFVGRPDNAPIPAAEIAAVIRDVSEAEVDDLVRRLDERYQRDGSACRVEASAGGYRLRVAEGLERLADRLGGRVRATRLTPAALECLAVVAYRQPLAGDEVDQLRQNRSGSTLNQLVRRGLLRCDPAPEGAAGPLYTTTDRLLRMLGLASLEQLPRVAELDD